MVDEPANQPAVEELKLRQCKEIYRFILATIIIGSFLVILLAAMIGGYADVPTLSGIFSGWIVAIVAFYFMEQASDRAADQQSTFLLNDVRRVANETVERAEDETESLRLATAEMVKAYEARLSESKRIIKGYVDACSPQPGPAQEDK